MTAHGSFFCSLRTRVRCNIPAHRERTALIGVCCIDSIIQHGIGARPPLRFRFAESSGIPCSKNFSFGNSRNPATACTLVE
jgi:hypothetical protein